MDIVFVFIHLSGAFDPFPFIKILSSLALGDITLFVALSAPSLDFLFLNPEISFSPGSFSWFFPFHSMCNS